MHFEVFFFRFFFLELTLLRSVWRNVIEHAILSALDDFVNCQYAIGFSILIRYMKKMNISTPTTQSNKNKVEFYARCLYRWSYGYDTTKMCCHRDWQMLPWHATLIFIGHIQIFLSHIGHRAFNSANIACWVDEIGHNILAFAISFDHFFPVIKQLYFAYFILWKKCIRNIYQLDKYTWYFKFQVTETRKLTDTRNIHFSKYFCKSTGEHFFW